MILFLTIVLISLFLISRIISYGPEEVPLEMKTMNIIEFAESLDITLYPVQKIILKTFYAGTKHNEDLNITEKDINTTKKFSIKNDWLKEKFDLAKNHPERFFDELVVVSGRRTGKSILEAVIATYELYKLLIIPDPQKYYDQMNSTIYVIGVGVSQYASTFLMQSVQNLIRKSVLLSTRVYHNAQHEIEFRTDADVLSGEKRGSVVFAAGSCNSAKFRGHNAIAIIYDEFAFFRNPAETYKSFSPSTYNFKAYGEGRNIIASTPPISEENMDLYNKFEEAQTNDNALVFQVSTWDMNPDITEDMLTEEFKRDKNTAKIEFGAQFI